MASSNSNSSSVPGLCSSDEPAFASIAPLLCPRIMEALRSIHLRLSDPMIADRNNRLHSFPGLSLEADPHWRLKERLI